MRTRATGRNGRGKLLAIRNVGVVLIDMQLKLSCQGKHSQDVISAKKNSRKEPSDKTSDLNPDPDKAKRLVITSLLH